MRITRTRTRTTRGPLQVVAVASAAVLLSACAGGGDESSDGEPGVDSENKTVKVGGWQIASGAFAGQAAAGRGTVACIEAANDRGGVNGWTFDIQLDDTAGDPARALQETKEQVEGGETFAMVWAPGTASNQSVLPYVVGKDMPYQPGMSYDTLAEMDLPNVFPLIPPYSGLSAHLADYAIDELGAEKIALLYENSALGQDTKATLGKYVESKGAELVAEVPVAPDDTDFTPMGIALEKAQPDAVISAANPTGLVKTKAAVMANGLDVPWLSGYWTAQDSTMELDPATTDGLYFNTYLEPFFGDSEVAETFRQEIEEFATDGQEPDIQAINGYASCQIFLEGFKRMTDGGDEPTQAGLIEAWESFGTTEVGVNPAVAFSEEEHRGNNEAYIIQWKDEAWEVIQDTRELPDPTS